VSQSLIGVNLVFLAFINYSFQIKHLISTGTVFITQNDAILKKLYVGRTKDIDGLRTPASELRRFN